MVHDRVSLHNHRKSPESLNDFISTLGEDQDYYCVYWYSSIGEAFAHSIPAR